MAHDTFYAICENKCRVDITDKVIKHKTTINIGTFSGDNNTTIYKTLSLSALGLKAPYFISVTPRIPSNNFSNNTSISVKHWVTDNNSLLNIAITKGHAGTLYNVYVDVCIF